MLRQPRLRHCTARISGWDLNVCTCRVGWPEAGLVAVSRQTCSAEYGGENRHEVLYGAEKWHGVLLKWVVTQDAVANDAEQALRLPVRDKITDTNFPDAYMYEL